MRRMIAIACAIYRTSCEDNGADHVEQCECWRESKERRNLLETYKQAMNA